MGFDPTDCIVIEDSVTGVIAARRAGMEVIGFVGGGHAYETLQTRLTDAGAVYVCTSMAKIGYLITAGNASCVHP
ncbi:HAD family phosphatase [Ciceribacter sp. RN22]|nr:HAD family phosphatase [Ciceribacter sp. RN22]